MEIYTVELFNWEIKNNDNKWGDWETQPQYGFFAHPEAAQLIVNQLNKDDKDSWDLFNTKINDNTNQKIIEYEALESLGITPSFIKPTPHVEQDYPDPNWRVGKHEVIE